jgi:flagellar M-ring protein FliF
VPLGLGLVALLVFFGMIRPAVRVALAPPPPGSKLDAVVSDAELLPAPVRIEPPRLSEQLVGARALAKENPAAVASIVRGWVSGESTS